VAPVYPQPLGSLFVTSYDSRDYGGGIRTCCRMGLTVCSNWLSLYSLWTVCIKNAVFLISLLCVYSPTMPQLLHVFVTTGMYLRSCCLAVASCLGCCSLAVDVSSRSTVLAFSHHVTFYMSTFMDRLKSVSQLSPFSFIYLFLMTMLLYVRRMETRVMVNFKRFHQVFFYYYIGIKSMLKQLYLFVSVR
jgi:hypothetical protein